MQMRRSKLDQLILMTKRKAEDTIFDHLLEPKSKKQKTEVYHQFLNDDGIRGVIFDYLNAEDVISIIDKAPKYQKPILKKCINPFSSTPKETFIIVAKDNWEKIRIWRLLTYSKLIILGDHVYANKILDRLFCYIQKIEKIFKERTKKKYAHLGHVCLVMRHIAKLHHIHFYPLYETRSNHVLSGVHYQNNTYYPWRFEFFYSKIYHYIRLLNCYETFHSGHFVSQQFQGWMNTWNKLTVPAISKNKKHSIDFSICHFDYQNGLPIHQLSEQFIQDFTGLKILKLGKLIYGPSSEFCTEQEQTMMRFIQSKEIELEQLVVKPLLIHGTHITNILRYWYQEKKIPVRLLLENFKKEMPSIATLIKFVPILFYATPSLMNPKTTWKEYLDAAHMYKHHPHFAGIEIDYQHVSPYQDMSRNQIQSSIDKCTTNLSSIFSDFHVSRNSKKIGIFHVKNKMRPIVSKECVEKEWIPFLSPSSELRFEHPSWVE